MYIKTAALYNVFGINKSRGISGELNSEPSSKPFAFGGVHLNISWFGPYAGVGRDDAAEDGPVDMVSAQLGADVGVLREAAIDGCFPEDDDISSQLC